jgi:GNAT superfamily N-acetyltransferase
MIEIRSATIDDAARLAELRWEFRSAKNTPVEDRDLFIARCAAWMRAQLTTHLIWRAWVAADGDRIVGQVWVHLIEKLPNPAVERERHLYVSNVYVTPSSRGGVGSRLVEAVLDWAASQNVDRVILWPTERSRPLYLRHGFTEKVDLLELSLKSS